jgi:hypothetical protein
LVEPNEQVSGQLQAGPHAQLLEQFDQSQVVKTGGYKGMQQTLLQFNTLPSPDDQRAVHIFTISHQAHLTRIKAITL